jgi:hypothetical protein
MAGSGWATVAVGSQLGYREDRTGLKRYLFIKESLAWR